MTIGKVGRGLIVTLAMQAVTGCGYIKSLFPDKERDYQFRSEIPELIVPDDLKGKTLPETTPEQMAAAAVSAAESESAADEKAMPADEQRVETSNAETQPDSQVSAASQSAVPVASSNATVSSLQIDQPQKQAWRLVARALSRQRMEIVERNLDKGYLYVNYDPHAIKPEDGSLWDEVTFLFGDDPSNEQEYRITVSEIAPQVSEVTIQDGTGKTLSDDVATSLLKLITDGINQGLSGTPQEESAEQGNAEKVRDSAVDQGATGEVPENAKDQAAPEKSPEDVPDQGSPEKTPESPAESAPKP